MNEIWKSIMGYEGYYEVSNLGNVHSVDRIIVNKNGRKRFFNSKILKLLTNIDGYLVIQLNKNGKGKQFRVNRLVAHAFIPNPDNKLVVNHKDCNKKNNLSTNLEWNTVSENTQHAYDNGLNKSPKYYLNKFGVEHNRSKAVLQYSKSNEFIVEHASMHEAKRKLNIDVSSISQACNGKRNYAGGFVWKLKKL